MRIAQYERDKDIRLEQMSNLYLCPDDFWRCPIDLNHQVLAKRFQYHIRRCMIANPHIHRVRCVFNANHLTTPQDLLNHMSTCPDAINTSTVLIGLSDIPPGKPWVDTCQRSSTPIERQIFHDVTATEDWDDDVRERQAKRAAMNEQTMSSTGIETSTPSPPNNQYIQEKSLNISKQAHVFKEHDNDGQIHPVETDELTKNLMKIRTLQLIGGAGRGTCCLLHKLPPGHPPYKSP